MSKREDQDPAERLKEWADHAYNPGYWFKHPHPVLFFKIAPSLMLTALIIVAGVIGGSILVVWLYFTNAMYLMIILLGLALILACIIIWQSRHRRYFSREVVKVREEEHEKKYPKASER